MRAISLPLLVLLSACGSQAPELAPVVDAGVTSREPVHQQGDALDLFSLDARFIGLECATVLCSKSDARRCWCSVENTCMREAAAAGCPARGCAALPWPEIMPDIYGLHFNRCSPPPAGR